MYSHLPLDELDKLGKSPESRRPRNCGLLSFWHDALTDLKTTKWRQTAGWSVFSIWTGGLFAALIYSTVVIGAVKVGKSPCTADGSFTLHPSSYNVWSPSGFFQITLGFGEFSFATAKAIDIVWDIVIGRMGQGILAFFAWKSFTNYVTVSMETAPVTYSTFWTTFIHREPHWQSIIHLVQEPFQKRGVSSISALLFMIFSMAFMIAFPTLASAMTGYQQNVAPFVLNTDGDLIAFEGLSFVPYIIRDGDRVNLTKDYPVVLENTGKCQLTLDVVDHSAASSKSKRLAQSCFPSCVSRRDGCELFTDIQEYVLRNWTEDNSTYTGPYSNLSVPLNISKTYFGRYEALNTNKFISVPYAESAAVWAETQGSTALYTYSYIKTNARCQPTGTYRWGFSYIQLCYMLILLFTWTLATWTFWIKARLTMSERGNSPDRVVGEFQAAIQLAAAIHEELKDDPLEVTESQLRKRIKRAMDGGHVAYPSPPVGCEKQFSLWKGALRWVGREKWWFVAMVLPSVLPATIWITESLVALVWAVFCFVGLVMAVMFGTTNKSRMFITLCVWVVGAVVAIIVRFTASGLDCALDSNPYCE